MEGTLNEANSIFELISVMYVKFTCTENTICFYGSIAFPSLGSRTLSGASVGRANLETSIKS